MQSEWTPAEGMLVRIGEAWLVLSKGDADALLNGNFGPQSREEVRAEYTLLLPACNSMAEAWDAAKALPDAHLDRAGDLWIKLGGLPGTGCSGMRMRPDGTQCFRPANKGFTHDLPELEQAIQRFKAIKQYIEVQNGNV